MEKEYTFDLDTPLRYTKEGEFETTGTLSFSKPGMAVYDELQTLSQLTMTAMMDSRKFAAEGEEKAKEGDGSEEDGDLDGNAIKIMLLSSTVKMSDVKAAFVRIAIKTCEVDQGVKIKEASFEKMDPGEFNDCMFGYIVNFIVPSLF